MPLGIAAGEEAHDRGHGRRRRMPHHGQSSRQAANMIATVTADAHVPEGPGRKPMPKKEPRSRFIM
jgi:hypothetical protein